jgi:regulation of enolase protein 1 (concanavalin A-like superfamily)
MAELFPQFPFPVTASHPDVWRRDETADAVIAANAFSVDDRSIWLRVSRIDRAYAYHASADGVTWQLIRVFRLGDDTTGHRIGFEAQSPTGDGCTVTFDHITFTTRRLADLRDGS